MAKETPPQPKQKPNQMQKQAPKGRKLEAAKKKKGTKDGTVSIKEKGYEQRKHGVL